MIVQITDDYTHTGPDIITDFTAYREVEVRQADPSMVDARPKHCITNSKELAEYGDVQSIKGFYTFRDDARLGFFHYWNYCPDSDVYWDSTPGADEMRYFVKR